MYFKVACDTYNSELVNSQDLLLLLYCVLDTIDV